MWKANTLKQTYFVQTSIRQCMKLHMRTKHSFETISCTKCDFKTKWQGSLQHHIESKHENFSYKCQLCTYVNTCFWLSIIDRWKDVDNINCYGEMLELTFSWPRSNTHHNQMPWQVKHAGLWQTWTRLSYLLGVNALVLLLLRKGLCPETSNKFF